MKIKFDENVSTRLLDAIIALEKDPAVELSSVRRDYGEGSPDPEWMFRFRDEGGVAMISGDHNILRKPVNLIAYVESGLISIWPPTGWPKLKRWGQPALMIRWWPLIKSRIENSAAGDRWRMQMKWTPDISQFEMIRDPRVD